MKHPVSHLVANCDLELRDEGVAHLEVAKAQLADDRTSDADYSLDAAFEEFEEIQNRNTANWHRGAAVEVAADLAETFYLKGRVAEQAAVGRSDLGWAYDFYRRAAGQVTPSRSFYQVELELFRARTNRWSPSQMRGRWRIWPALVRLLGRPSIPATLTRRQPHARPSIELVVVKAPKATRALVLAQRTFGGFLGRAGAPRSMPS